MNQDYTLGFVFGICAGVAIGVLYAPNSGAKTRRLLAAKAQEGIDTTTSQAADALEKANRLMEKGRSGLNGMHEGIRNAVDAGKKAYQQSAG